MDRKRERKLAAARIEVGMSVEEIAVHVGQSPDSARGAGPVDSSDHAHAGVIATVPQALDWLQMLRLVQEPVERQTRSGSWLVCG